MVLTGFHCIALHLEILSLVTYQENPEIRVRFVMVTELNRSRKSPVLCGVASFCSSSPSGISLRLKFATFFNSFQAAFGLFCIRSQRGDSGMNLQSKPIYKKFLQIIAIWGMPLFAVSFLFYYTHFEITGCSCNLIDSQQCNLLPNSTILCSKSHPFLSPPNFKTGFPEVNIE